MAKIGEQTFDLLSTSPEHTRSIAEQLGGALLSGDVICLQGDLGAGKTTFVQGLAHGWGSQDMVSSPTFILVNLYRRADGAQLFHFDTYRLESIAEAEELDLEAMMTRGALIIEWPERLGDLLPRERLWIHFEHVDEGRRRIRFLAANGRPAQLLERIHHVPAGAV